MLTNQSYYQILSGQARLHPDKPAVVMGQKRITYAAVPGKAWGSCLLMI